MKSTAKNLQARHGAPQGFLDYIDHGRAGNIITPPVTAAADRRITARARWHVC